MNPQLECVPQLVTPKSSTIRNSTSMFAHNWSPYPQRIFTKHTGIHVKVVWKLHVKFGKDLLTSSDPIIVSEHDRPGRWQNVLKTGNVGPFQKMTNIHVSKIVNLC